MYACMYVCMCVYIDSVSVCVCICMCMCVCLHIRIMEYLSLSNAISNSSSVATDFSFID